MAIKDKIKVIKSRPSIKGELIHDAENLGGEVIKVKTPRREYDLEVGDITISEATEKVKEEYPTFTEFEYKTITYKKTGKKGEFIKRIDPPEKIEQRWQKKKEHIRELSDNVGRLKNRITRDLKGEDEKDRLSALAIAIMLRTGERVGNDESAEYQKKSKNDKRKKAYGVTGFKKSHVTIVGNKVHLDYIGKKGVPQEKSFSDEKIAKALKTAIKNCKGEFIFETPDCNITSNQINDYLKPFNISAKAIRGYSANRWVLDKLKSTKPEDSERKRKKQLAAILKMVAAKVGHGPSVLKNQYLMPEVITSWIDKGEVFDIKEAGYVMKEGGKIDSKNESLSNENPDTEHEDGSDIKYWSDKIGNKWWVVAQAKGYPTSDEFEKTGIQNEYTEFYKEILGDTWGEKFDKKEDADIIADSLSGKMSRGGIPNRYKEMGFTRVGQKKKSIRPEKKWMVLAKKGDKYRVVHGGQKGMEDFSQHHDKERQKRFWNRMGGFDSEKAKDPFSPLYWHKKFGTWEEGGIIENEDTLPNGDNFANSEKNTNFVLNPTKDEIQNVISGKGGAGHENKIRAAASYLRGSQEPGSVAKGSKHYKEQEAQRLRNYISQNNLWIPSPDPSRFLDEGCEQKTYLLDRENVVKVNDAVFFSTWEDYFNSLLLHNYFFPDTSYELLGFTENDGRLFAIVKQPYIKANQKTNLDQVRQFMADNGFINTKEENYENKELGLILEDLHGENVLTKDGILYFIDTVFYISDKEGKKQDKGGEISESAKKQIDQYIKEGTFIKESDRPIIGFLPIYRFNGSNAGIFPSQLYVDRKGVEKWKKRIEAGERPYVLIDYSEWAKQNRVKDGHHRLKAYEQLGFTEIPVIDVNGMVLGVTRKEYGGSIIKQREELYKRTTARYYNPSWANKILQEESGDNNVGIIKQRELDMKNPIKRREILARIKKPI